MLRVQMIVIDFFQDLYDAGIGMNAGTDESEFINILNNRSFAQLNATFGEYENISQETIEESIEKEFSGDIKNGLLAIGKLYYNELLGFHFQMELQSHFSGILCCISRNGC